MTHTFSRNHALTHLLAHEHTHSLTRSCVTHSPMAASVSAAKEKTLCCVCRSKAQAVGAVGTPPRCWPSPLVPLGSSATRTIWSMWISPSALRSPFCL